MSRAKSKGGIRIGAGVTSVVMVLMVLVFTTFAVLSYTTAAAEERLTRAAAEASQQYYEAEALCEEITFVLEELVMEKSDLSVNINQMGYLTSLEQSNNLYTASFAVPLGENTEYRAVYEVSDHVQPISRKIVNTAEWTEEILDLWDGE